MKYFSGLFYLLFFSIFLIFIEHLSKNTNQIPSILEVLNEIHLNYNLYFFNTLYSFLTMLLGFALSLFTALIMGYIVGYFPRLNKISYRFLITIQSIPLVVLAPWVLLIFGFGMGAKIFLVYIFTLSPIAINFIDKILNVEEEHLMLMKVMNASKKDIFFKLLLPSAMPNYFSGAKISASYSFSTIVISEWIGGYHGLGVMMQRFIKSFKSESILISSFIIIAVSFLFFKFIEFLEKKILHYQY